MVVMRTNRGNGDLPLSKNWAQVKRAVRKAHDGHARHIVSVHQCILDRRSAAILWQQRWMHVHNSMLEHVEDAFRQEGAERYDDAQVKALTRLCES